jgi:hypothetical protein
MSTQTLDEQFIGNLNSDQKGLIWEYYNLIVGDSVYSEQEADMLARIWELAEEDEFLCRWLELIDYFYTGVSEEDEILSDDERAYFSEHMGIRTKQGDVSKREETIGRPFPRDVFAIFKCPNAVSQFELFATEEALNSPEVQDQECVHCGVKLSKHERVYLSMAI